MIGGEGCRQDVTKLVAGIEKRFTQEGVVELRLSRHEVDIEGERLVGPSVSDNMEQRYPLAVCPVGICWKSDMCTPLRGSSKKSPDPLAAPCRVWEDDQRYPTVFRMLTFA